MPDLHGWITQQIDETQRIAEAARGQGEGRWHHETGYHSGRVEDERGETVVYDEGAPLEEEAAHIALHDPAAVLRRCEADRRILARHRLNPDNIWYRAAMCDGCGTYGEFDDPETDNLNECPELLDLAYAHGLTEEILNSLDRPTEGERPEQPAGPTTELTALVEAYSKALTEMVMNQHLVVPRPEVKALEILAPELKKIPGYVPTTEDQP